MKLAALILAAVVFEPSPPAAFYRLRSGEPAHLWLELREVAPQGTYAYGYAATNVELRVKARPVIVGHDGDWTLLRFKP